MTNRSLYLKNRNSKKQTIFLQFDRSVMKRGINLSAVIYSTIVDWYVLHVNRLLSNIQILKKQKYFDKSNTLNKGKDKKKSWISSRSSQGIIILEELY